MVETLEHGSDVHVLLTHTAKYQESQTDITYNR